MSRMGRMIGNLTASRRMKRRREGTWKPWNIHSIFDGLAMPGGYNVVRRFKRGKNPGWMARFFGSIWRAILPRARKEAQAKIKRDKQLSRELSNVSKQASQLQYLNQSSVRRRLQHKG